MVPVPERLTHGGKFELLPVHSDCIAGLSEAVIESKAELVPWMSWCRLDYSIGDTTQWVESRSEAWERGKKYSFVIADRWSNQIIGTCGLNHLNEINLFANLGYWVRTSRTREGAATEATLLLSEFGFSAVKLVRIEIVIAVGNLTSEKVAERVGAVREGLLRNRIVHNGEVRDAYMYSLLPNPDAAN